MALSIDQWHRRYLQQARWTESIRKYLYRKCAIQQASRVLDVGCGTGVLEHEFPYAPTTRMYGIDIDFRTLLFAQKYAATAVYSTGDCLSLPYKAESFDITLCHFLLLWIDRLMEALSEMTRVTLPGGHVLAIAEPDYGGRIDYPGELSQLGDWQTLALKAQGANPYVGRQLRSIFIGAGLKDVETGVLGGQWEMNNSDRDFELEWQVLSSDLKNNIDFEKRAGYFKNIEITSREAHQRILFVPVFYAIGKVRR